MTAKHKFKVVLWIFPEVVLDDVSHAFHWLASISFVAGPWIPCPKRELGSPEVRTAYPSLQKELLETCDGLGCLGPRLDVDATEGLGAALAHEAQRGRARMGTL